MIRILIATLLISTSCLTGSGQEFGILEQHSWKYTFYSLSYTPNARLFYTKTRYEVNYQQMDSTMFQYGQVPVTITTTGVAKYATVDEAKNWYLLNKRYRRIYEDLYLPRRKQRIDSLHHRRPDLLRHYIYSDQPGYGTVVIHSDTIAIEEKVVFIEHPYHQKGMGLWLKGFPIKDSTYRLDDLLNSQSPLLTLKSPFEGDRIEQFTFALVYDCGKAQACQEAIFTEDRFPDELEALKALRPKEVRVERIMITTTVIGDILLPSMTFTLN